MLLADFDFAALFMSPFAIPICAIVCVFIWLTVASISESVAQVLCHKADADLKQELVARGFSPDEITRVVESGRKQDGSISPPVNQTFAHEG